MWDWLANLLQTAKIQELEKDKADLSERAEAADLAHKDARRLYRSMKQGFDARGEELLVKQETLRITNDELSREKAETEKRVARVRELLERVDQLEGEAEEGRKAFHELAGRHDNVRSVLAQEERATADLQGQLSAKEQQIGKLKAKVKQWGAIIRTAFEQSDELEMWQALYGIKHQQLMDTVDAYREYRRGIFQLGRVGQADKARVDRQIARLEETVKRKDARVAYLEEELRRSLKRDPKTGRIIGGNYRGPRK